MFARIDRMIIWLTSMAVIVLMMMMILTVLISVFFRYVLNSALPWPEELSRFIMIWVTMVSSGLVMRYGGHIAITFIPMRLKEWRRVVVVWMVHCLVILFLIIVLWYGAVMVGRTAQQWSPALQWSLAIRNIALPLGSALMLYHIGAIIIRREDRGVLPPKMPFV
jgi:TRAP-type transport system small permease protein